MWNNCCCEYDTVIEDDCCPDWCENKKVKGRFGLAFVAETPCCCPEPIGWQVEFCDTPSNVEQRCREMVQWVNCPPLPRCEPCPPNELCSPCSPPKCNPCCPISNPCPPRCPPRCRPLCDCCPPRRPSPRRYKPSKMPPPCCCSASKSPPKCNCSSRPKPCCRCDDDFDDDGDDEDEDEFRCPCCSGSGKKGNGGARSGGGDRHKRGDDIHDSHRRGDDAQNSHRRSDDAHDSHRRGDDSHKRAEDTHKSNVYDDEVPVKESKSRPQKDGDSHSVQSPPHSPPSPGMNKQMYSKNTIHDPYTPPQVADAENAGDSFSYVSGNEWEINLHDLDNIDKFTEQKKKTDTIYNKNVSAYGNEKVVAITNYVPDFNARLPEQVNLSSARNIDTDILSCCTNTTCLASVNTPSEEYSDVSSRSRKSRKCRVPTRHRKRPNPDKDKQIMTDEVDDVKTEKDEKSKQEIPERIVVDQKREASTSKKRKCSSILECAKNFTRKLGNLFKSNSAKTDAVTREKNSRTQIDVRGGE